MKQKELPKRYVVFFIGLMFNAFGVAFVTKAALGTSPIASIPYSLSIILPGLSLGNWVIVFNLLLIVIQLLVQRTIGSKLQTFLEVIITFCFGYGIDFSMFCLQFLSPHNYVLSILYLVIGCCIIALGALLEVVADVVMLPGDAFVRAIAKAVHREYGQIRIISDISMSVIAGVICLIFLHELVGVREGTVISALLVGNLVKLFSRLFSGLGERLFPANSEEK